MFSLISAFRVLFIISVLLFFQEQYFIPNFIKKGFFLHHLLGSIAILGTGLFFFETLKKEILTNIIFQKAILFLSIILITTFLSSNRIESIKYWLVIFYGLCFSLCFYVVFKKIPLKNILFLVIISLFIASIFGLYDFIAQKVGLMIFNKRPEGDKIISEFLTFGSTADYTQLFLSILIPFGCSKYINFFTKKEKWFLFITIFLGIIMLIGTTRIAVLISFLISLFLLIVNNIKYIKTQKIIVYTTGISVFLGIFLLLFKNVVVSIVQRTQYRILNRKPNDLAGDFFLENIEKSLRIFQKYPLTGIGLGNSKINVLDHIFSVHGTFFRLLAETGILGCISFLFFIISLFFLIIKNIPKQNKVTSFCYQFLPFFIGIIISSIYNIHFFRVEFWFFIAVVMLLIEAEENNTLKNCKIK